MHYIMIHYNQELNIINNNKKYSMYIYISFPNPRFYYNYSKINKRFFGKNSY